MQPAEQEALLRIALAAACADGTQDDRERDALRKVVDSLQLGAQFNLPALLQDALLGRTDLRALAAALPAPPLRQLAFELAVGVCDADGLRNDAESTFLADLGQALGLTPPQMAQPAANADALVTAAQAPVATAPAGATVAATPADEAALDKLILDTAITNGALELLPQSLATMAILAMQMRMVYRVGAAYGEDLDREHLRDFLAAAGVSLAGQYIEQIGRGIVGGLFGAAAGNLVASLARGATGAAFSFATTYALGQVAKRYYAGGRVMSTAMLKEAYAAMLADAKSLQARYQPQIAQRAGSLDASKLAALVRGG